MGLYGFYLQLSINFAATGYNILFIADERTLWEFTNYDRASVPATRSFAPSRYINTDLSFGQ